MRRGPVGVGAVVAAVFLVFASAAWACVAGTSGPRLTGISPTQVTGGSTTTVSGAGWAADAVALRLSSGASLGTAYGPSFSVQVQVPQIASGFYSVLAAQGATEVSMPIQVARVGAGGDPTGGTGTPGGSTSISTDGGTGDQGSTPASVPAAGALPSNGIPSRPSQASPAGVAGPSSNTGGVAPGLLGAGPAGSARQAPASATSGLGTAGQGSPGFAGGATASTSDDGQQAALEGGPTPKSASGELWSGFSSGTSRRAAGLVDQAGSSGPASQMAVALGLGVLGVAALLGGFAAAEVRRRRAPVTSSTYR